VGRSWLFLPRAGTMETSFRNCLQLLPGPLVLSAWRARRGDSQHCWPLAIWRGASDHSCSLASCLMGSWATLCQQSINTIDFRVPGNAVLLGRGSWLHLCIKGSDYIKGTFGSSVCRGW
jgi:hypothetical protein